MFLFTKGKISIAQKLAFDVIKIDGKSRGYKETR